jgi:inhibitor of cysteine peptidase
MVFGLWCLVYAQHPKMVEVDRSYDGREVTLAVGAVVELSLAENPTTGFRWDFVVKPEPACTIVKNTFEPATGSPGKGGIHRWQFKAARPGVAVIDLEYRRPWEKETPASRTFKLTISVQ